MGYDDWTDWDEDAEALAYHEAGHATAAVLCAVGWEEVATRDVDGVASHGWTTYVAEHYCDTSPANLAFIAWAGSWAHARCLSPEDLWRMLPHTQTYCAESDMEHVHAYLNDPAHAPHETEEEWVRALDGAWSHVEALAERLARERVVRTPLHPEYDGDM